MRAPAKSLIKSRGNGGTGSEDPQAAPTTKLTTAIAAMTNRKTLR
jgi:hypothetical protein